MNIKPRKKKGMVPMDDPDRSLYKWIVIGMSLGLPAGIAAGIILNQILLGLLTGNSAGFLLGVAMSRIFPN